jgi:hypothetical protein
MTGLEMMGGGPLVADGRPPLDNDDRPQPLTLPTSSVQGPVWDALLSLKCSERASADDPTPTFVSRQGARCWWRGSRQARLDAA